MISGVTALAPQDTRPDDELDGFRARLRELEAQLGERRAAVARLQADLEVFRIDYRQKVGLLHEQLDELELAIAEAELGELAKRVKDRDNPGSAREETAGPRPDTAPRFTSDGVRKLFRDVAKAIHPDLASDDVARVRRHTLMVEANRAYAMGDEEQLRLILQAWERSPEAVQGTDAEAMRMRLIRRIEQTEEQLDALSSDVDALKATPLWKLKAMADEAAARGKDLVGDMVKRLKRDIMVATNRLEAIRPPQ